MQACVHCAHANPGGTPTCAGCACPLGLEAAAQATVHRDTRARGLDPAKLEGRSRLLDSLLVFVEAIRGAWYSSRSHGHRIGWYVLLGAIMGCLLTLGLRLLTVLAMVAIAGIALLVMQIIS